MKRWSEDAYRELEACETRDAERGGLCCLCAQALRSAGVTHLHLFAPPPTPPLVFRFECCPTCGRRLDA